MSGSSAQEIARKYFCLQVLPPGAEQRGNYPPPHRGRVDHPTADIFEGWPARLGPADVIQNATPSRCGGLRVRFSRRRLPESALRRKAHQRVLYAGSAMRPDDNEWKRKTMGDVGREDIGSADGSCPATCRRWPRSKSQEAPPWPSAGVPAIARRRRSRVSGCYKAVRIVRPPTGILRRSSGSVAHHPWQLSVAPRPVLEASSC
jgi:hypothetical protein